MAILKVLQKIASVGYAYVWLTHWVSQYDNLDCGLAWSIQTDQRSENGSFCFLHSLLNLWKLCKPHSSEVIVYNAIKVLVQMCNLDKELEE